MKIIPVMDLIAGQVVHARRGERENYRPVQSTLCPSAAPEAILQALIEYTGGDTVYVADLDGIRFRQPQWALLDQLKKNFGDIKFWLDSGVGTYAEFLEMQSHDFGLPVIGSENLQDAQWISSLAQDAWILSLDFRNNEFMGPTVLRMNSNVWPARVLAMNLARVGSEGGPDFALLRSLQDQAPHCSIVAAGGVRDENDLLSLTQQGIGGALVATALHNGKIPKAASPR